MRYLLVLLSLGLILLGGPSSARADIVYLYDDLGRLVRVIRQDGEAATYHYDAVGNILQITRERGVAQTITVGDPSVSGVDRATTTTVTLSGSNLVGASVTPSVAGVTIQNVRSDLGSLTFDLVVSADAPLGAATLTIAGGAGTTTTVVAINPQPPVVNGFAPAFAPVGAPVTIVGQSFDPRAPANNTVLFNGVAGVVLTATATAITATVPSGATSGPLTVSHAGGSGQSTGTFVTGQVTTSGGVTPTSGTRGATVHVTVTGTNLLGATLSRPGTTFTNVVATATQVAGDAAVSLDAPREAVITVSNQVTAATVAFPVQPGAPAITVFTPISGAVGDLVNITGSGFDEVVAANNLVRFNGVASDIVSVEPTKLVTHVPAGATTGPLSVTTSAGTATSAQSFTVAAAAPLRLVTNLDAPFSLPISIALRPDGLRAYVVNEDRNSVGVVDTATHAIIATVAVGRFPVHAAVSPDGSRLWVVNTATQVNDTVSVIDLSTNTVVTTIALGRSNRRGRAFVSPDGRTVLVTHPDESLVSIIDAASLTVAAVLPTGSNPVRLAFTPDSARAYVNNNSSSGTVTVIDVVHRTVLTTIGPVNFGPIFALMAPDGSRYYTVNSATVTVIDTATNAVVATISPGGDTPATPVMNAAGTRIYVAEGFSTLGTPIVVAIDTASNTVVATLPIAATNGSLGGLTLTPDGQRLLVSLNKDSAATLIDTATNTVMGSVPLTGAGPTSGVALLDNRRVYLICQESNTICLVDLATATSPDAPVSRTGAFTALLAFTPGGAQGFAKAGFFSELVVGLDPATNTALPNIVIPRAPSRPSQQVINLALDRATGATLYADNSRQLVFAATATGAITGILTIGFPSGALISNLDGTRLYDFAAGGPYVIDVVNQTVLTTFVAGGAPVLSADGARLYVTDTANNAVKVIETAGLSLLATIPVGTTPIRLAFTAGGQTLLAFNSGSHTVSVIDVTSNTVTGTIGLSGTSFGAFVAVPNGPRAFIVNRTNARIDVLDTSLNIVITSIPFSPAPDFLALTPDGTRLFAVQAQAGAVTAIDTATATLLGSLVFPVGANGLGQPVFAPNGRVYIPRRDFDSVLVLE